MKRIIIKIFYLLCVIFLLFLISIIPTSAKEFKTCTRTDANLHVKENLINNHNLNDIMQTPCVDEVAKVYDFADLLTDIEEEQLYGEVSRFITKTNYDLILVTINQNNKDSAEAYADDFYDYNDFGKGDVRDGLLILIDMDNRELYISTTGNAIKMYDDERLGIDEKYYNTNSVLDCGYDYIVNGEYYNTFSSMINRLTEFYDLGVPSSNIDITIDDTGKPVLIRHINYSLIGIISTVITTIIAIVVYNISRLKIKTPSTISYLKKSNITLTKDTFVNSVITHTLRNVDTGSSGGFSGGSSYHSSSSGSFHGGGGRHF